MSTALAREHADAIAHLRTLADVIPASVVGRAFVASLGSRDLEARSALGSYAVARVLPDHVLAPVPGAFATICAQCGWSSMPPGHEALETETRAHYASERQRYGGIRHLDPQYASYDLSAFRSRPPSDPTAADWHALALTFRTPALLPPDAKAADLERALESVIPSNRGERATFLRILAYAGVLEDPAHPGFFDGYVPPDSRDLPPQRFADWGYPVVWWRARHGVRTDAAAFWFPESSDANAA